MIPFCVHQKRPPKEGVFQGNVQGMLFNHTLFKCTNEGRGAAFFSLLLARFSSGTVIRKYDPI